MESLTVAGGSRCGVFSSSGSVAASLKEILNLDKARR